MSELSKGLVIHICKVSKILHMLVMLIAIDICYFCSSSLWVVTVIFNIDM